jgi:hypothetical protein
VRDGAGAGAQAAEGVLSGRAVFRDDVAQEAAPSPSLNRPAVAEHGIEADPNG